MLRIACLGALLAVLAASASVAFGGAVMAQGIIATPDVEASPALKAARAAGQFSAYIMPARGHAGSRFVGTMPGRRAKVPKLTFDRNGELARPPVAPDLQNYFPNDMAYFGGPVLASVSQVNYYFVADDGSLWGFPAKYESDLNKSPMVELLDRYTFQPQSSGHWPVAKYYWRRNRPAPALLYDSDIAAEVQTLAAEDVAAGRQSSASFSTVYHVFLPPGTDACFDNPANGCYSPDGSAPGPFAFCGYHSYTTLPSGQSVVYDVEPYANVKGCSQSEASTEVQDQANTLGHEFAEEVSDPIPGAGWYQEWPTGNGEIGDECAFVSIKQTLAPGHIYYTQDWYSTAHHACSNVY
jgi:hypothetical protein